MKQIITFSMATLLSAFSFSQGFKLDQINLVGGRNYSTFRFVDSEGTKDQTLDYESLNTFGVNFNLVSGRHILRPELSFRQAGAKSDVDGTALSWKMNYLDVNLAYLVNILDSSKFVVAPGIGLGTGYMLNGEQYIGTTRYALLDAKALKPFDLGFQALMHIGAKITENMSVSLEYRFGRGIAQIENDKNAQKSHNIYQAALLGIGCRLK